MRAKNHQPADAQTTVDDDSRVVLTSEVRELNPVQTVLRNTALFADLSDVELARIAQFAELFEYPKQSYLFHGGDPGGALLIVVSGVVEIRIERTGAHPIPLTIVQSGEFLGEMSFFDGQPRSAAAIALVDCQILRIQHDASQKAMMASIAAGVVAELAKRVRRTDATLAQLTADVSRAAYVDGHTAVAVELEAIKTLYRRTEAVAGETLERADRRATEVMARADQRASEMTERAASLSAEVQGHVQKVWTLLKRRVAPVAFLLGCVLTWFGIDSVQGVQRQLAAIDALHKDVKQKSAEVSALSDTTKTTVDQLTTAYRRVRVLEETFGELRAVRDAAGLDRPLDTPVELKRAALNYERAKAEVRARYFRETEGTPRFEQFPPEVVFNAVDTYVSLVMGGADDGKLRMAISERREVLHALGYVLSQLGDLSDSGEVGDAALMLDKRVRDMLQFVAQGAEPSQLTDLQSEMSAALVRARSVRSRDNLALSLADLRYHASAVVTQLNEMMRSDRPQRAAAAAFALALLGESRGVTFIDWSLAQPGEIGYATALQLAEAGAPQLAELGKLPPVVQNGSSGSAELENQRLRRWIDAIERALMQHIPRNCYEERYTNYLSACLHGACGKLPEAEDNTLCPSFAALR